MGAEKTSKKTRRIPVRRRSPASWPACCWRPRAAGRRASSCSAQGGIGGQVDRIKGAIGAGKDSAADQNEALRRKIEETRERLRSQMDAGGNGVGGEDAFGGPAGTSPGDPS